MSDVTLAKSWRYRRAGLLHIADPDSAYPVSLCDIQLTSRPEYRFTGPAGGADCERCRHRHAKRADALPPS